MASGDKVQENADGGSNSTEATATITNPSHTTLPIRPSSTFSDAPTIKVSLSLSPPTHCFTRDSAPIITLKLTLLSTSSPPFPVTLYTEKTPLDIRHALSHRGFTIHDLTTDQDVANTTFVNNAMRMANPRQRVRGCAEEPYFLTLDPSSSSSNDDEATAELSHPFGRAGFRPQPWSVVQGGHEVDATTGAARAARRSRSVTGVDGLEPGHEYEVGLDVGALRDHVVWAPARSGDILLERGYSGPGALLDDYPWVRDRPLEFRVETVRLRVLVEEEEEEGEVGMNEGV